jgi:putative transposase
MKTKGYNQRRACALAGIDPRVYRRKSKRPADTELRTRMKELASERRRFCYRRLHILLKREGWPSLGRFALQIACRAMGQPLTVKASHSDVPRGWKKLYRLYREEGLTVRKRGGRKRAVGTRTPMRCPAGDCQSNLPRGAIPQGLNQRWSLDFMSDALEDGRRFRVLNVIDDFSRE